MRLTTIRGLPVVDPLVARRLGAVLDVLIDPATSRLAALEIQPPQGGTPQRIAAARVRRIGRDAVMLSKSGLVEVQPMSPDDWIGIPVLQGMEVLDEDGDRVNYVADADVDQDRLKVNTYELSTPSWQRLFGKPGAIPADEVTAFSSELMIVRARRRLKRERRLDEAAAAQEPRPAVDGATPEREPVAGAFEAAPSSRANDLPDGSRAA